MVDFCLSMVLNIWSRLKRRAFSLDEKLFSITTFTSMRLQNSGKFPINVAAFDINRICKITETKAASLWLQHELQETSKFRHNLKTSFLNMKEASTSLVKGGLLIGWALDRGCSCQGGLTVGLRTGGPTTAGFCHTLGDRRLLGPFVCCPPPACPSAGRSVGAVLRRRAALLPANRRRPAARFMRPAGDLNACTGRSVLAVGSALTLCGLYF